MFRRLGMAAIFLFAAMLPAFSADYPARPIRIMVGFAPGGGTDLLARILAEGLAEKFGQTVLVENRPGAAGTIAASVIARAQADGYTLWLGTQGSIAVAPFLQSQKPYDPIADFTPISMLMKFALQIFVRDDFPARSFKEFIELLKQNPGKYSYATAGIGGSGHLFAELLIREAGIQMVHVPYPGDSQSATDVLGGVLPIWSTSTAAATPFIGPGKVRGIVTSGDERLTQLPDLPTAKESGYPNAVAYSYNVLMAPKGTPSDVVIKLNQAIADIYNDGKTKDRIVKALGFVPEASSPADAAKFIDEDIKKWRNVVAEIMRPK